MKKLVTLLSCIGITTSALTVTACSYINTEKISVLNKVQSTIDSTEAAFKSLILAKSENYNSDGINNYVLTSSANVVTSMDSDQSYSAIRNSVIDAGQFDKWSSEFKALEGNEDYIGEQFDPEDENKATLSSISSALYTLSQGFGTKEADVITGLLNVLVKDNKIGDKTLDELLDKVVGFKGTINTIKPILKLLDYSEWQAPESFKVLKTNGDFMLNAEVEIANLLKSISTTGGELLDVKDYIELGQMGSIGEFRDKVFNASGEGSKNVFNGIDIKNFDFNELLKPETMLHIKNALISLSAYISTFDEYYIEDPIDGNHLFKNDIENYKFIVENNKKVISYDFNNLNLKNLTSVFTNLFNLNSQNNNFNSFRSSKILFAFDEKIEDFDFDEDFITFRRVTNPLTLNFRGNWGTTIRNKKGSPFANFTSDVLGAALPQILKMIDKIPSEYVKLISSATGFFGITGGLVGLLFNTLQNNDMTKFMNSIEINTFINDLLEDEKSIPNIVKFLENLGVKGIDIKQILSDIKPEVDSILKPIHDFISTLDSPVTLENLLNGSDLDIKVFDLIKGLIKDKIPEAIKPALEKLNSFNELFNLNLLSLLGVEETTFTIAQLITEVFNNPAVIPMINKVLNIIDPLTSNTFLSKFNLYNYFGDSFTEVNYKYDLSNAIALNNKKYGAIYAKPKDGTTGLPEKLTQTQIVTYILGNYDNKLQAGTLYGSIAEIYQGSTGQLFKDTMKLLNQGINGMIETTGGVTKEQKLRTHKNLYSTELVSYTNFENKDEVSTLVYKINYTNTNGTVDTYQVELKTNSDTTSNINNIKYEVVNFGKIN